MVGDQAGGVQGVALVVAAEASFFRCRMPTAALSPTTRDLGDGPGEHRGGAKSAGVDGDVGAAVTATYEAGVLTVRVTGAYAGSEPQRIAIK